MAPKEQGESELLGVVPGSFKQAMRIATDYVREYPGEEVVIKRGEKVLERVGSDSLAATAHQSAA